MRKTVKAVFYCKENNLIPIIMMERMGKFFIDTLEVIVFAVAIFLFVYLLILQPHKIKGASMEPNFPNGEYLLSDKVSYRLGEPDRGDVIIFQAPTSEEDEFIKRIIGLPGDTVAITNQKVVVNGELLNETYLPEDFVTDPGAFLKPDSEAVVPEDNFFVLGDNRSHSSDSRAWGFVPKDKITGKAWIVYWPPQNAGTVPSPSY